LGEGRTNTNFIAEAGGARYFVRLGGDIAAFRVSRAKEQAVARAAAAACIGPEVVYTAPGAMVCRMIDGSPLTPGSVQAACSGLDAELLGAIVSTFRQLHSIPPPPELVAEARGSSWAPLDELVHGFDLAEAAGYSRQSFMCVGARRLTDAIERWLVETAGCAPPPAVCHMDLLLDNIIRGPAGLFLIDFEYACLAQPLLDLAIFAMGANLDSEHEAVLLHAYFAAEGEDAARRATGTFDAFKVLATVRETMWGVRAEVSGTSALSLAEAEHYVDLNLGKLRNCARKLAGRVNSDSRLALALKSLLAT
jgi:thiamine kinase-like enzyme